MTVEYRDETPFTGDDHTPTELANAIRTKKYGKDVREPIAQLAGKLDSAIKGQSIGNVVATPTKVFANLSALQSAYPNGADGVMITTDNGHKYFWQNNSWVDGGTYQAVGGMQVHDYISASNFEANLPDCNSAQSNTIYRIILASNSTDFPSNTPYADKWGSSDICVLKNYGETEHTGNYQTWEEMRSKDHKIFYRYYQSNGVWTDWVEFYKSDDGKKMQVHDYISASNFEANLPDCNSAQSNTIYRIILSSNSTDFPSNTPYTTRWGPSDICVLKNYGETEHTGNYQTWEEMRSNEHKIFYRYYQPNEVWTDWVEFYAQTSPIEVKIGANETFKTITEGVMYARNYAKSRVIVKPGTYDLISEFTDKFGENFFANYTTKQNSDGWGLYLGNNDLELFFESGANVFAYYNGNNQEVSTYFSPFMFGCGNQSIINGHIECSNVKYVIHDDPLIKDRPYTHRIERCYMRIDNGNSQAPSPTSQAIGGGLCQNSSVVVKNNVVKSTYTSNSAYPVISYHNALTASAQSSVTISDNYVIGSLSQITVQSLGPSTRKTVATISNNSVGAGVLKLVQGAVDNIDLYAWGNEIRGES